MGLPFLWIALGFSLGIVAEKYGNLSILECVCGLGGGIVLLWFLRGRRFFLPIFVLLVACAGFLWARLDAHVPACAVQNYAGSGRITLRGVVDSLPEVKTRGKKVTVSFVLEARSITKQEGVWRKFHRVSGNVQTALLQSTAVPQVGDALRLYGELSVPRTVLNPGEFDYGKFLAQKNIRAVFQSIGSRCVHVTKTGNPWALARMIAETRRRLARLIDKLYSEPEAAILKALALGLRSDIPADVRSQFMKTGTIHLLAISGMNITMIAGTFYLLFLFCGLGFRKTALTTILIVVLYVGIAGAGIPIQRAGYGAVLVLFAALAGRPSHLLNSLCFAFFVILVWNPQSLWNIGFQLSFLCVLSLMLILPLLARVKVWTLSLGSSLAVLLGTFPVVLFYFNIFSPVSVLANIVAIPLCDAALFMSLFAIFFSGVPLLGTIFVKISSWSILCVLAWVKYLSAWQWGYLFLRQPSLVRVAAYYAGVAAILFLHKKTFRGKRFLMAGLICGWLSLAGSFLLGSGKEGFELSMLSSGRNQIVHVRFSNGNHWLLNTGRNFPSDQGEWLIDPYLRHEGIQRLEGILLTDLSKKNIGGLISVLRDFPVRHVLYPATLSTLPEALYKVFRKLGSKAKSFQQGDAVGMDPEKIRVIAQSTKGAVLLIASGPWRILLIPRWEEGLFAELLRSEDSAGIHAVFLPAPGPETPEKFYQWLNYARPDLVVFPEIRTDLMSHLISYRIPWIDLKCVGALNFRQNGSRLELASYRNGFLGVYAFP